MYRYDDYLGLQYALKSLGIGISKTELFCIVLYLKFRPSLNSEGPTFGSGSEMHGDSKLHLTFETVFKY